MLCGPDRPIEDVAGEYIVLKDMFNEPDNELTEHQMWRKHQLFDELLRRCPDGAHDIEIDKAREAYNLLTGQLTINIKWYTGLVVKGSPQ